MLLDKILTEEFNFMKDITKLITYWVDCSNNLYQKWFAPREDGLHEFISVEEALLDALVLQKLLEEGVQIELKNFFNRVLVQYNLNVSEPRMTCAKARSGNIVGELELFTAEKGTEFFINTIDTTGNMLGIEPYSEVKIEDKFILEPVENLNFFLIPKT